MIIIIGGYNNNGNNATFNVPTVPAPPEGTIEGCENTLNTVTCTF